MLRWEYRTLGIDSAFFPQLFSRYDQGLGWTTTCHILSREPLALFDIHWHLLLFPLYPLFKIFWHPLMLFFLQHAACAGGIVLTGLIAFQISQGSFSFGIFSALAFLLFPQHVLSQTSFDFSFLHLSLFFIPAFVYAVLRGREKSGLFALGLLVIGSEELGLTAAFLLGGACLRFPEKRKTFLGAALFFLCYVVVVLKNGPNQHAAYKYEYLKKGFGAISDILFSTANWDYLKAFFLPYLLVPVFMPTFMLMAIIPGLTQNLLASTLDTHTIGHHYSASFSACLSMANLFALARIRRERRNTVVLLQLLLILCFLLTFRPFTVFEEAGGELYNMRKTSFEPLEKIIPTESSLSCPTFLATHFWQKKELFYFPMHADDAEWVVVPKLPSGFPAVSLKDIEEWVLRLSKEIGCRLVIENPMCLVFQRAPKKP